jgi:hypothetical protein
MPSNVFLYQLPEKTAPLSQGDKFLIEDIDAAETKITPLSAIGVSVFEQGFNFRIKDGQYIQLKEMSTTSPNFGLYRNLVMFNGTVALSGVYES